MKRHFDELGRIVIPKDMREELDFGINDFAEIEVIHKKIVLSNPKDHNKNKQFDFLIERENKLQQIEYLLKNVEAIKISDIKNILEIEKQ